MWTGPAADNIIGYQGPTEAYIGLGRDGRILGVALGRSYDNEPYVDYVRDDTYFRQHFNRYSVAELGQLDLKKAQVEGVSGATMTSLAVARGLVQAAREHAARQRQARELRETARQVNWRTAGTAAIVLMALVVGLTNLRGVKAVRLPFQVLLIGYLGLLNGDLLSQAMLAGWAQNGVPWRNALGLVVLTAAAVLVPIVSRNNVYCNHVCPHGAAQQLFGEDCAARSHCRRGSEPPCCRSARCCSFGCWWSRCFICRSVSWTSNRLTPICGGRQVGPP